MPATTFRIERLPITHPDSRLLVEAVQAEYVARYGGRDESPVDPADFEDPLGQFFVGYLGDEPVAASASRWLVWILDGPAPKRPSAGRSSAGICSVVSVGASGASAATAATQTPRWRRPRRRRSAGVGSQARRRAA